MGFKQNFADPLRGRLNADGHHATGTRSPRGPLPNSRTNLWLTVHRQPLEGATRFEPRYLGHFSRYRRDLFSFL